MIDLVIDNVNLVDRLKIYYIQSNVIKREYMVGLKQNNIGLLQDNYQLRS